MQRPGPVLIVPHRTERRSNATSVDVIQPELEVTEAAMAEAESERGRERAEGKDTKSKAGPHPSNTR